MSDRDDPPVGARADLPQGGKEHGAKKSPTAGCGCGRIQVRADLVAGLTALGQLKLQRMQRFGSGVSAVLC